MHKELADWFAEHEKPTHVTTDEVHAALLPIVALVARVEHQVVRHHELRRAAMLAAPDRGPSGLRPKIENMGRRVTAVGDAARALLAAAETLSERLVILDQNAASDKADIARAEALDAAGA